MPYMGYYGIDMYYIVLVLPCVLFAFWAQSQVNGTFNRYSRVMSRRGPVSYTHLTLPTTERV